MVMPIQLLSYQALSHVQVHLAQNIRKSLCDPLAHTFSNMAIHALMVSLGLLCLAEFDMQENRDKGLVLISGDDNENYKDAYMYGCTRVYYHDDGAWCRAGYSTRRWLYSYHNSTPDKTKSKLAWVAEQFVYWLTYSWQWLMWSFLVMFLHVAQNQIIKIAVDLRKYAMRKFRHLRRICRNESHTQFELSVNRLLHYNYNVHKDMSFMIANFKMMRHCYLVGMT